MFRNKFVDPDTAYPVNDNSDESVLYQSFYNPDFSAGSLEIEKLGASDVRPYQLPVNKIDVSEESTLPEFRPLDVANSNKKIIIDTANYDENKFEHLGGGVIAKKQDATNNSSSNTINSNDNNSTVIVENYQNELTTKATKTTMEINVANANYSDVRDDTDNATSLDDIFQELLLDNNDMMYNETASVENNKNVLESRIVPDSDDLDENDDNDDVKNEDGGDFNEQEILTTTPKLNFMNMKNFIMQMQQNKSDNLPTAESSSSTVFPTSSEEVFDITRMIMTTTQKPTTTFIEVETVKHTRLPSVTSKISEPQLFPSISKWEFVNGTRASHNNSELSVTKKVFNETLQAVVVENAQVPSHATHLDELKANQTVDKGNLQQLSSIFDTLAAKLGIKPDVSSKLPPFSQHTQNKHKQSGGGNQVRASTRRNTNNTTTLPIKQHVTTPKTPKTTKKSPSTVRTTKTTRKVPTTATPRSEPTRAFELSSESFFGQAAEGYVEAVDPTQYEEILSLASSPISKFIQSTTPSLVTLMPVKSNSGIRNFNPRLRLASSSNQQASSGETRNMETVVKASMSFDS